MTSPTSTTTRLMLLLSLLQTRRDWPGTLLADRLEISGRTVRRDVERLREMGYSIQATMGPDGGYRLEAGSELPPLLFDEDQAVALAIGLRTAVASGAAVGEAAVRALTTVRQLMPSRLRHRLDALQVSPLTSRTDPVSPEVLVALSTAIRDHELVRFDYGDAPRRVEPHHLVSSHGRWYLVAWDRDRDDWRIFTASRIAPKTPTGPRFIPREVPGGDVHEFVAARFKGSNENAWQYRGTVILHLPAAAVLPFADDGVLRELGTDRCSLEDGSWSWESLAASFGRFDAELEVVGPPELAAAFGVLAERYARAASR